MIVSISGIRASILCAFTVVGAACASAPTSTSPAPAPSTMTPTAGVGTGSLSAPGYRPEFGTMWTFDAPPIEYWRKTYGFAPDQRWLDHVRLASVRLPGCSASFVSSNGLVMTNHHCGRDCTASVSPKDSNYIETGFAAATLTDEKKCPGLYVDQLISIEQVTDRVRAGITGSTPSEQASQRSATIGRIQGECAQATGLTCQVVTLYQGGIYSLYRYKRYSDIRLVMAPEGQIAFFGGDPDNFTFPRYNLDVTLLRVYENNQPFKPTDYLKWSANGAAENEPVFVIGNPGTTRRLNTVAQMEFLRDVAYPAQLAGYKRMLDTYSQLAKTDTSSIRRYQNEVFGYANSQKAVKGYYAGLIDSVRMAKKRAFESEFRARVAADPALRARYGATWDAIAAAQRQLASFNPQLRLEGFGGNSTLLTMAAQIVRLPSESSKPNAQRLAAYRGNNLETIKRFLTDSTEIDLPYEKLALTAQLRAAQQELPRDDPFLKVALAGRTPEAAAEALISGTRLTDPAYRRSLVEGGAAAVAASNDPLIVLARAVDPMNRGLLARADSLNAIIATNAEAIGQAVFSAYGTSLPPDATFTLRITDGVVRGYPLNGTLAPYKTTFYGLYERAASFDYKDPFQLPQRWASRRDRLNLSTPFNFVSTNDIIGGNSGSPVINRNAEVVGLVFDGNYRLESGVASCSMRSLLAR